MKILLVSLLLISWFQELKQKEEPIKENTEYSFSDGLEFRVRAYQEVAPPAPSLANNQKVYNPKRRVHVKETGSI
jgi:hypothetical protein